MSPQPKNSPPRRLRRAEAVLQHRMRRLAVVIEDLHDPHNIDAVARTAEAFGVQNLYRVEREPGKAVCSSVTQGAGKWLTSRRFDDADTCLAEVRDAGYTVWAADVSEGSHPLDELELPPRLAVVMGSELHGLSPAMREGAHERFYLPMVGFTGSLNVSVTAALVIWELVRRFIERDGQRGDLSDTDKAVLRERWYHKLARTKAQQVCFPTFVDDPPDPLETMEPPPLRGDWLEAGGTRKK